MEVNGQMHRFVVCRLVRLILLEALHTFNYGLHGGRSLVSTFGFEAEIGCNGVRLVYM